MQIRRLNPDDAPVFSLLRLRALQEEPMSFSSSPEEHAKLNASSIEQRLSSSRDSFVLGAFDDSGELTGMVGVYRHGSAKQAHKAFMWGLYVSRDMRGRGVGRQLVEAAIEESATISGVELVCTSVFLSAATARALYPRCGFTSWGVEPRSAKIGAVYVSEEHFVFDLRESSASRSAGAAPSAQRGRHIAQEIPTLLIIDMQKGMAAPSAGQRNNPEAERNIAALLGAWRKAGAPVVHVRHISRTVGSPFWPGQTGAEFQEMFAPCAGEHLVEKNVPDALINTGLEKWLRVRGITRVIVVGVSTNNSVEATARTAGNLAFDTQVVADATFAFEKVDYAGARRTAEEVHAMALANLEGEYATITTTQRLLDEL